MAETPSQPPSAASVPVSVSVLSSSQYWCYQCNKSVSGETQSDAVVCYECKNGFIELIPAAASPLAAPSFASDHPDDNFGSQFLQMLRIIAHAARDEDAPQQPANAAAEHDPNADDNFLRIELDGWDNDEDENEEEGDEDDNDEDDNEVENDEDENEVENGQDDAHIEDEQENNAAANQNGEENREEGEEDVRRRRRELRLRIRDFATRARTGRNRMLDWADILMGLEDNSTAFRLETDRYIGNPEDYVDAAGYEALLQNLAESDGGKRGSPPASKSAVLGLEKVEIKSEQESAVCAICKDMVAVGELETKMPCGHGYHGDCIVPWLEARNSCPVCRFELPTDDAEYEKDRNKGVGAGESGAVASGSGGD